MGYEHMTIFEVVGSISKHNSPRDDEDMDLVNELRERLTKIVEEEKYQQIRVMIV